MKYSIITATYNAEDFLEQLINSIAAQKNPDVEFIIIDGNSTDSTIDIIKRHEQHIDKWISEPDKGIYDAWNKGIALSTGDWIMFMGADDYLASGCFLTYDCFLKQSENLNLDYISAKVQMVNRAGVPIWVDGEKWRWPAFQYKMMVAHPGSLHSRGLFQAYGIYNLKYKITGDYELLLRAKGTLKAGFVDEITVCMTEGGVSDSWPAILEYINSSVNSGGGHRVLSSSRGLYMFVKSRINTLGRKFGFNFNKRR